MRWFIVSINAFACLFNLWVTAVIPFPPGVGGMPFGLLLAIMCGWIAVVTWWRYDEQASNGKGVENRPASAL